MKSRRAKACDISPKVKKIVWERDNGRCVVCGNAVHVMPNAHYISRAKGGLGIEENIVTLCTEFSGNQCHRKYDFGSREEHEAIGNRIKQYLMSKYQGWDEKKLYYRKVQE